jgi:lipoprotein-anchoring transpeptidase ErfK/SrfK
MIRLQVLLDRAGVSPGVIDGYAGENVAKAIGAYETIHGHTSDGVLDADLWTALSTDAAPVMVSYTVTAEDLAGPYIGTVPADYAELAKLDRAAYATPAEMLAERFHMDIDLLRDLNPELGSLAAGSRIVVAATGNDLSLRLVRLEADKTLGQVRGYDADGRLVVAYPATIGSADNPSPAGTHTVTAVVRDAEYSYRPDVNFQQGNNTQPLTLPPGPNNPIGSVWIDLSEPTYGIHGTPEPSLIDKTRSHGCVRLTNWDALELATMVSVGTPVDFL